VRGAIGTTLRTSGPFEFGNGRAEGRPTVGRLSATVGSDEYRIDAFNGDPATFTLTANVSGATTGYTVPWSSTYHVEAPSPVGVNVGF